MNPEQLQALPPEMQARLASIMAGQQQAGAPETPHQAAMQQPAPVAKPPSLMDHLIALRQEVAAMRQEIAQNTATIEANSGVVDAVGQAVGEVYQMFQSTSNQGATYSQGFQQAPAPQEDY